ncbi:hypothetical protein [Pseudobacillus wudalianchiensis]|uniref:Uncharacterized protein n=1 Tax=Pseudobacillus wudalianchiensis TaxID=1743143 RepID=A0A1B9B914_9BACI|nr:hypothetical protein [Bacillus wudalianchiensis]OCA92562.1 hypothetical protein A8F95_02365 [Bacillus wudalianchiensis]
MKAKFNVEEIMKNQAKYTTCFIEMVKKYENVIIEVEEEVFDGYEAVLEEGAFALDDEELIFIND